MNWLRRSAGIVGFVALFVAAAVVVQPIAAAATVVAPMSAPMAACVAASQDGGGGEDEGYGFKDGVFVLMATVSGIAFIIMLSYWRTGVRRRLSDMVLSGARNYDGWYYTVPVPALAMAMGVLWSAAAMIVAGILSIGLLIPGSIAGFSGVMFVYSERQLVSDAKSTAKAFVEARVRQGR